MQEVHSKDGDIVHVLDSSDLNAAKDAVIEYLGKVLKWMVGVGIPALIAVALFASKLRGDVDRVLLHSAAKPLAMCEALAAEAESRGDGLRATARQGAFRHGKALATRWRSRRAAATGRPHARP